MTNIPWLRAVSRYINKIKYLPYRHSNHQHPVNWKYFAVVQLTKTPQQHLCSAVQLCNFNLFHDLKPCRSIPSSHSTDFQQWSIERTSCMVLRCLRFSSSTGYLIQFRRPLFYNGRPAQKRPRYTRASAPCFISYIFLRNCRRATLFVSTAMFTNHCFFLLADRWHNCMYLKVLPPLVSV